MNPTQHVGDAESKVLARLGRDINAAFELLLAEIHSLDERSARDDGAAHLVELAYNLRAVVEPLIAFARLDSTAPAEQPSRIDVKALLAKATSAPDVAPSFRVTWHGDLGESFDDRNRLEQGLVLCLRLMGRVSGAGKARLHVRREVHQPVDHIVLVTDISNPEPVALALLNSAAVAIGAKVELDGNSLSLGFVVGVPVHRGMPASATPVLAFRRSGDATPAEPETAARALILIVDDEPAARAYMSRILELEGFEVVSCSTLEQADEAVHSYRPDVVMLDRLLLEREDRDWVRRFESQFPRGRTPLVLLQSAECESLGLIRVSDIVRKPIDRNEVVATVERLTGVGSPPTVVIRDSKDDAKWQRCLEGQTRVVTALNVSNGRRVLDTATPRIVIVDVRSVDGAIEMLEEFRRSGGRGVPVVAVHGRLSKKNRLRLDAVADARLTHSMLSRRSLDTVVRHLDESAAHASLGAG